MSGYDFYRSIGSPKFIVAPMVEHSKLSYRMLTRKYSAELCYTPMINSKMFVKSEATREREFKTCPEDRPLFVQFCGNDPDILLEAAKYVEDQCDAVDINLGCPQGIAKKGNYGSFLLENTDLIVSMVQKLRDNLKVPVTCKIRCLRTVDATLELCRAIEQAGCSILTVHGRLREHKKNLIGPCNWEIIRKIKESVSIPVFANGGIRTLADVQACMDYTGWDGVMTSEAILENPAFFEPEWQHIEDVMLAFLELAEEYDEDINTVRNHLYKSLFSGFKVHTDLRDRTVAATSIEQMREITEELKDRRTGQLPEDKIEWYHRYWKGHKTESPYTDIDFEEFVRVQDEKANVVCKTSTSVAMEMWPITSLFKDNEEY